jgi:hypothetical protein
MTNAAVEPAFKEPAWLAGGVVDGLGDVVVTGRIEADTEAEALADVAVGAALEAAPEAEVATMVLSILKSAE